MAACNHGCIKSVKLLVKLKVPYDHSGKDGETPLLLACRRGFEGIVDVLLKEGANPNYQSNKTGNTPLIAAVNSGNRLVVEKLLQAGANPNILNNYGMTALDYSELAQRVELQQMLRVGHGPQPAVLKELAPQAQEQQAMPSAVCKPPMASLHGGWRGCDE